MLLRTDFKINKRILVSQFDSETKIEFYPVRDKNDYIFQILLLLTIMFDIIILTNLKLSDSLSSIFILLFFFFLITNFFFLFVIIRFLFELFKGKGFKKTYFVLKYLGFRFLKETIILDNNSSVIYFQNVFDKQSNFHKMFQIEINSISKISFKNKEYSFGFIDKNGLKNIIKGYFILSEDIYKVKTVIKDKLNENKNSVSFIDDVFDVVYTSIVRLN